MRRWDSSWDYMKGRGATGGEEKGEISVFDLDPEQGLHLSEGRGEEGGAAGEPERKRPSRQFM